MEEKKETRPEEFHKKLYKKPQIITEEMFARPAACAKCDTGPVQDPGCLIFGSPQTS